MTEKLILLSFVLNILLGVFMFVFGEIDDSPGALLIGLVASGNGVAGLIIVLRSKKKDKKKDG